MRFYSRFFVIVIALFHQYNLYKKELSYKLSSNILNGADEENRTPVVSLEG